MGLLKLLTGASELAAGIALDATGVGAALGTSLMLAGAGQLLASTLGSGPVKGFATTRRDPIAAWEVCYGEVRQGGVTVHIFTWGQNNIVLDLCIVLACHPIDAVTELLFNQQRVQINTSYLPHLPSGWTGNTPCAGSGTSFSPQEPPPTPCSVQRDANGLVTCIVPRNIPFLTAGDHVFITEVVVDQSLNSSFIVDEIISQFPGTPGSVTFTFLSGGAASSVPVSAKVQPLWLNVGANVYVEYLLGTQGFGHTFVGMEVGTPYLPSGPGSGGTHNVSPLSPQELGNTTNFWGFFTFGALQGDGYVPVQNPFGPACSFTGKSAAMLRLIYDPKIFNFGIPQIAFKLRGVNSVYDPRLGDFSNPATHIYTQNAALIIADFLTQPVWGFRLNYGTDIPLDKLAASANSCDEAVSLVSGLTEPRYRINGKFDLSRKRGEILTDLLSACAGRLTVQGGQYIIHVGVWPGDPTQTLSMDQLAGPIEWRPTSSIREHFNSCKGTFISPDAQYTSTDFPPYQEDGDHGFTDTITGDVLLTEDDNERRYMELHLPFCTSVSAAQRLAKIALLRSRYSGTGTFTLNASGASYSPCDLISATIPALGWTGKVLEVIAARLIVAENDGGIVIGASIDVRETDSSVYAWSTEEQLSPENFVISPFPRGIVIQPYAWPWSPGYAVPLDGDAMYPNGSKGLASFGLQPAYGVDGQGNASITLAIKGVPVINQLDFNVSAPWIICTPSLTGGNLVAGTYIVGLSAKDAGSGFSDSDYLANSLGPIQIDSGATGSIAVEIRMGSGDDGGTFYLAKWNDTHEYVFHRNIDVTADASSAVITDLDESQAGGPDPLMRTYGIVHQQVVHGGCWALQIHSLDATSLTFGADGMTLNQWQNYTVSLLAKLDPTLEIPFLNGLVASSTASSGDLFTLVIGPNSNGVSLPDLTTLLVPGDLILCRFHPTFTGTSFSDPNIANGLYPSGDTAIEAGHLAVCLTGVNAGDVQTVSGVGLDGFGHSTVVNLATPWTVTPNPGDIVIVVLPVNTPEWTTSPVYAKTASAPVVIATPEVSNLAGSTWLIRVRTENAEGVAGPDSVAPFRELYLFGGQGTRTIFASTTQLTSDGMILCDTTSGPITCQLLSLAVVPNIRLIVKKVSGDANAVTILPATGETIDGASSIVLATVGDLLEIKANG